MKLCAELLNDLNPLIVYFFASSPFVKLCADLLIDLNHLMVYFISSSPFVKLCALRGFGKKTLLLLTVIARSRQKCSSSNNMLLGDVAISSLGKAVVKLNI